MWITLLVMALAVSLEPFRIGMTVLMLHRPRPALQLLALLCGGFAMGMTVGLVVLFVVKRELLAKTHLSLPRVQAGIGVLALLGAAYLAARAVWLRHAPKRGRDTGALPARTGRLLRGRSPWVAAVAGLGIALPSVDYLAALAVILASGAAAMTQAGALVMFNAVAFAPIEIPLGAYLLAPDATRTAMASINGWIRSRRHLEVAALLTVVGGVLLAAGLSGR